MGLGFTCKLLTIGGGVSEIREASIRLEYNVAIN